MENENKNLNCSDNIPEIEIDCNKLKTINQLETRPKSVKFEFTTGEVYDENNNFLGYGDLINGMLYIDTESKNRERKPILQMSGNGNGIKLPPPMDGKAKRRQRRKISRKNNVVKNKKL